MTNIFIQAGGSIAAASSAALPGDVIHLAAGTYQGGFTTTASGTALAHITYVSDVPGGAKISGGGSDMGWWNKGNFVDIKGIEIDGRQSPAWRFGFYGSGSNDTFQGGIVHDIMTDPTAFANAAKNGAGGAAIEMDNYSGAVNSSVFGNLVYNVGPDSVMTSSLVHGIYQITNGQVYDNVIYNVVGVGITLWHGAQNINIANNTIDGARDGGIFVGSGDGGATATTGDFITVENNIVTNSNGGIYEGGTTGIHNTYTDNLLFNNTASGRPEIALQNGLQATKTVFSDPLYVNRSGHDYSLQAGSPAIDAGTAIGSPLIDFLGNQRPLGSGFDIGAYEAGGVVPVPLDTLTLVLSEDRARNTDAQFIAKIDGHQISGAIPVTTSHSSGATKTFSFTGAWGVGVHDLEIDFANPIRNGSRVLYVDGATYDGVSYLSNEVAIKTSIPFHIQI